MSRHCVHAAAARRPRRAGGGCGADGRAHEQCGQRFGAIVPLQPGRLQPPPSKGITWPSRHRHGRRHEAPCNALAGTARAPSPRTASIAGPSHQTTRVPSACSRRRPVDAGGHPSMLADVCADDMMMQRSSAPSARGRLRVQVARRSKRRNALASPCDGREPAGTCARSGALAALHPCRRRCANADSTAAFRAA